MEKEENNKLEKLISDKIDKWANDLIEKIVSGGSGNQRGLWDRFKGGLYNLFLGRTGKLAKKHNPYYWQNKFGDDLGSQVEESLTLSSYGKIKSAIESTELKVENQLNLFEADHDRLKIVITIRTAANELKNELIGLLKSYPGAADSIERGEGTPAKPIGAPESDHPDDIRAAKAAAVAAGGSTSTTPAPTTSAAGGSTSGRPSTKNFLANLTDIMMLKTPKRWMIYDPSDDWLKDKKLNLNALPSIIAWFANKTNLDLSNDDIVEAELKKQLKDFEGIEKKDDGNSLIKTFIEKGLESVRDKDHWVKKLREMKVKEDVLKKLDEEPSKKITTSRTVKDMVMDKKTKEEIVEVLYDDLISRIDAGRNKRSLARKWKEYVSSLPPNPEEAKQQISEKLIDTIVSWGLGITKEQILNLMQLSTYEVTFTSDGSVQKHEVEAIDTDRAKQIIKQKFAKIKGLKVKKLS